MGQEVKPINQQAANFFKVIALAVTLNEYYSYLKDDLISIESKAYDLKMQQQTRWYARKMDREKPKFMAKIENDYSRLPKLLDKLENTFERNYDKVAVQMFIDVLHNEMNKIECEVIK